MIPQPIEGLLLMQNFRDATPRRPDGSKNTAATAAFMVICRLGDIVDVDTFEEAVLLTPDELAVQERTRVFRTLGRITSTNQAFAIDRESLVQSVAAWKSSAYPEEFNCFAPRLIDDVLGLTAAEQRPPAAE